MITVIGGVYSEYCMHPPWNEVFGSAGRAVSAISALGCEAALISHIDKSYEEILNSRVFFEGFKICSLSENMDVNPIKFSYTQPLAEPTYKFNKVQKPAKPINVEDVLQFGMLEDDPVVHAKRVVYDPQNKQGARFFKANGSTSERIAHVLNYREACTLTDSLPLKITQEDLIRKAALISESDVIIMKMGARGALVFENDNVAFIPSFITESVWPIGSGDVFSATFAYFWLDQELAAPEAAYLASKGTAYYSSTKGFVTANKINSLDYPKLNPSELFLSGVKPKVYLAGPFFNTNQLWLIEQARVNLLEVGLDVFSPYHDIGLGNASEVVKKDLEAIENCDFMVAMVDGLDSGTIYEIGYARALKKGVIIYSETESKQDLKMMEGSDCLIFTDYSTAIYQALWLGASL